MANWLRKTKWSKVDLVDRPADPHAKMMIWKSEDGPGEDFLVPDGTIAKSDDDSEDEAELEKREFSSDQRDKLAKEGKALPDGSFPIVNKEDLKNAVQAFGRASDQGRAKRHIIKRARALGATDLLPENWQVSKSDDKEEGAMPKLSEEVRKSLPDEALEYIEDLENKAEEGKAPSDGEDLTKRDDLPEDVRAAIAKRDQELESLSKRLETAETIAKNERDARLVKEWETKLDELSHLNIEDKNALAKRLKETADIDGSLAEDLMKSLTAANAQAESGALFEELGKGDAPAEGSAEARIEALVKSYREKDSELGEAEAWDLVLKNEPELYAAYEAEEGR